MKVDIIGPIRFVFLILFLIGTRGTPFFWLGFYFLIKEIKFYIKFRR